MKTAVEWLEDKLYDFIHPQHRNEYFLILNQAKQMEKEQVIESHKSGQHYANYFEVPHKEEALKYYNETYKNTNDEMD